MVDEKGSPVPADGSSGAATPVVRDVEKDAAGVGKEPGNDFTEAREDVAKETGIADVRDDAAAAPVSVVPQHTTDTTKDEQKE